jgi:4-hydroxy-tetrahydrodipicolinate synthase
MSETTRRTFLGTLGAAAVMGVADASVLAEAPSPAPAAKPPAAPQSKMLFWVAAVTPCDKNLNFDEVMYKEVLAHLKDNGADGVVVLGTTGEYPSFSTVERKKIAEVAFKNRNGLNIIVSTGTSNFPETIELSQHAAANGADSLLIVPPFYYKNPPLEGLVRYYSMIFDKVPIPINLYHIPFASGIPIPHELLHALEKYPNLAGIKDSESDAGTYQRFVQEFPSLNMRTGTTENLKPALEHGMGAILAEGNVFTKQIAAVFAAKRAGKDINEPLNKLDAVMKLMGPSVEEYGPMKYALSLEMGSRLSYPRPPNTDVTDEQRAAIRQAWGQITRMS